MTISKWHLLMTGKQLKNSILQWAIQGKLVPQDPNDEPASVLLEKIRAEKARLIKEGKIKKDKKESIIFRGEDNSYYEKFADGKVVCIDDEIPFEIASGWEWCRFSSIYWQLTDGTHSTPKYTQSGIPFLSVKDMSTGRLSFANTKFISEEEHKLLSQRCHPCKGDLLLSKVGTTGIPLIIDDDREFSIFVSLALIKFFPKFVDSSFLIALLNSPLVQMQVKENTRGVGNKNWVLTAISNTLLAIPPLREQQRIVEKIDILSPYTDRYAHSESKISHLNKEIGSSLKKSILHEAIQGKLVPQDASEEPASVLLQRIREEKLRFVAEGKLKKKDVIDSTIFRGDDNKYFEKKGKENVCIDEEIPFEIPDTWVWVRLSNVVQVNPKNDVPDNTLAAFIPMERIDATYLSSFTYSERKWGDIKSGFMHFADGDVAFAKITPCFQNRKSMILKGLPNGVGAGTTELKVLRPYAETIDREYLLFFLESSYFVEEATFKGTANQQRIISGYMENKLFPLPPLSEQRRIAEKIKESYMRIGL